MLRSYPVSTDEITQEHWAIVKKIKMKKQTKLYKKRLEYLRLMLYINVYLLRIPLFMLKKAIKLYLNHKVIDIGVIVEQVKNHMLNIESESD